MWDEAGEATFRSLAKKVNSILLKIIFHTEQAGQSSKSHTIEMYAPSSYNDTMTGETLSSVSEKSETYSQDGDERPPPIPEVPNMPNRHMMNQVRNSNLNLYLLLPEMFLILRKLSSLYF